ncbi:peptide-binding protein [uncultured Cyclobacterium sp.]|uniref:right-handed parallel beta-helix repeat-containing protein n=1 Tax=uncultured Cyclobacterium sp. TaxID=453820 RepID=UPI0030ECE404
MKRALLILATFVLISCDTKELAIYVSSNGDNENAGTKEMPIQTIEKALEEAIKIRESSSEPITIHLKKGEYHLSTPLVIPPELSNIAIIGEGTDKVSVKGSMVLNTNWKPFDENIWITEVGEDLVFDQLYIDGEEQILARYPNFDENGGAWQGHAGDAIAKERVATWKNPVGGFVHAMHSGRWGGFHYEISGVDSLGALTLIGGHQNNRPSPMHPELRMVENIFEELDSEGEWYFDKQEKLLYLWAKNEANLINSNTEVSVLKHLIEVIGRPENPVKNVKIEGIRFEHTMRTFMEQYNKLLRSDWTIYRGGSILLSGTEAISIKNCEFTNLGGNAIFVNGYNRNSAIIGNHIHNVGATAISFVGDSTAVRSPSYQYSEFVPVAAMDTVRGPANDLYPADCKVANNLIYKVGRIEKQVAGIQLSTAMNIHAKNNSIYDVPRAGINVSEGTWGGHLIENNDVFNTVLETGDHGAFNSWGRDRFWHPNRKVIDSLVQANPEMPYWDAIHTTIIRNNRFRCDHGWDIDLDDGSSNYHIYNNLCLNGGIKLREGFDRVVENNIMINNGFHPHVWFANSQDVFRKNITMTKHFPIRLTGWGKEVDYNLFPDAVSLALAQENNTDAHSLYGDPKFVSPETGDFTVAENSPVLQLGFKNFPMDNFGVQKAELKAIAKQPYIPELNAPYSQNESNSITNWLGGTLKNVETLAEQSASGLHSMAGVIVLDVKDKSKLAMSGITEGDVVVGVEGEKIKNIAELFIKYRENLWHGYLKLSIVRNQKEREIRVNLQ